MCPTGFWEEAWRKPGCGRLSGSALQAVLVPTESEVAWRGGLRQERRAPVNGRFARKGDEGDAGAERQAGSSQKGTGNPDAMFL